MRVVELLEVIDVHHEAHIGPFSLEFGLSLCHELIEAATVVGSRQRIGVRFFRSGFESMSLVRRASLRPTPASCQSLIGLHDLREDGP